MKEKTKSCLSWVVRLFVLLVTIIVFGTFSGAFRGLWGKCIASGAFASYALVLASKWGVIEWLQVHGCEFVAEMASCRFCLSWWLVVFFGLVGFVTCPSWLWIPAVFLGTVLCWLIVRG